MGADRTILGEQLVGFVTTGHCLARRPGRADQAAAGSVPRGALQLEELATLESSRGDHRRDLRPRAVDGAHRVPYGRPLVWHLLTATVSAHG
ncbi:hypothetical protein Cch01nite_04440 [Cellulomonas chitinilytica]|uniref:Uncharacterized protein n=1 Tax=Cellulomonas chitinilytica TaxID=398759 RepID=A0A919NZ74_9CELL|nr:hypothetical protein Cch01nite_04440 [Cellulomonas chitinilytica]